MAGGDVICVLLGQFLLLELKSRQSNASTLDSLISKGLACFNSRGVLKGKQLLCTLAVMRIVNRDRMSCNCSCFPA